MNLRNLLARRYVGSSVAFAAGALLSLAFAPAGWWPLALLMPTVLFLLWDDATPRRAAVLGFWFNAGTFAAGTYWLYIAIVQIGHAPLYLAVVLMGGLVAIMGAYHALLGWAVARFLPGRGAWRWLIGIPAAWLLIEWFRSWFLTGFGWLALGYSQTDTWLAAFAPVVGQYGIGLLVLLLAGALTTLVLGTPRERMTAGAVFVAVWAAGFALRGIEWTQPTERTLTVAVAQGAVPQDEKRISESMPAMQELYRKLTLQASGAQLIVWPESAVADLANNLVPYYRDVYQAASAQGSALVIGTLRAEENPRTGELEFFNSVLVMDPGTRGIGWYDKHHLVPYTEFVPVPQFMRDWLRRMNLPSADFDRGAALQQALPAAGQHISATVCYEDAYGSTQLPLMRDATVLVNVTNDAWFGRSSARYQHLQISRMRTQETGRPMVRAANDGVSAVIDHRGAIIARAPEYEPTVLRAELQPHTGLTPYARTGNWLVVSLALALGLAAAAIQRFGNHIKEV